LRQDRPGAPSNDGLDAALCIIDHDRGILRFAGANRPLLVHDGRDFQWYKGDRASLGYVDSPLMPLFTTHAIALRPGQTFYLFTDGVTDQVGGPHGRLLGRRRMQDILADRTGYPLVEQRDHLFQALADWRGAQPRRDDMTFLAFRV
jgi:two-component system, sensor histidine kinase SagS